MGKTEIDETVNRFGCECNCAQTVLLTYGIPEGVDEQTILRIATAFGSGVVEQGEVCGAVVGAIMAIGLKHGMIKIGDGEAAMKAYEIAGKFIEKFKERNVSIRCKELLGYDISTPQGLKIAETMTIAGELCPGFVRDAAEILEELDKE
jgi:C_GCAxxG_C_C family probable redox protein